MKYLKMMGMKIGKILRNDIISNGIWMSELHFNNDFNIFYIFMNWISRELIVFMENGK
jgi:hypothetical protein